MFQSYKFIKHLKDKNDKWSYEYELTDSEFGTVCGVTGGVEVWVGGVYGTGLGVGVAVIQEYSKLKLNVGKNLALAFSWYHKQHPYFSIQEMIDYNKKYNLLFSQYEEDLQKYLPLL